MNPLHKRDTSPGDAVNRGMWSVNGPVMALILSAAILPILLATLLGPLSATPLGITLLVTCGIGTWCLAWLWWSISVPRWRLWAYTRVEDLDALHQAAVSAGLLWPEGHFFERTEIYPRGLRDRIALARRR